MLNRALQVTQLSGYGTTLMREDFWWGWALNMVVIGVSGVLMKLMGRT